MGRRLEHDDRCPRRGRTDLAHSAGNRVMVEPDASVLPISIRVFTDRVPTEEPNRTRQASNLRRRLPREALVFDTETYLTPTQELMVLPWRLYRDMLDREPPDQPSCFPPSVECRSG
jgi:hypothetical protein